MTLSSAEQKRIHGELSHVNAAFLDFVQANPECLEEESFAALDQLEEAVRWPLQPWPIFLNDEKVQEGAQKAIGLCRLVKSIPQRVFEFDVEGLAKFYGLEPEHARLASIYFRQQDWQKQLLARPDFMFTPDGFRCLECNLVGNLGGWEGKRWADAYHDVPVVARFLEESRTEVRCTDIVRKLLTHMLRHGVGKFRTKELNIAFVVGDLVERMVPFIEQVREEYGKLLEALGLSGVALLLNLDELEACGEEVWGQGHRLHSVVEQTNGPSSPLLYRSWVWGRVLLYNGPFSGILTDKRNLAILSQLQDSDRFDDQEQKLLREALPWTRLVASEPLDHGLRSAVPEEIRQDKDHLILKPGDRLGGDGVVIGALVSDDDWARSLDLALQEGDWVVQERVVSPPYRYLLRGQGPQVHDIVFSFFVVGDDYGGGFLRLAPLNPSGVVNVAQGTAVQSPIFEVDR